MVSSTFEVMDTSTANKHWRFATNEAASVRRRVPASRGFRLEVALGAYFADPRARCALWLPAAQRARPVRWLAERLHARMRLPGEQPPALLSRGALLPPGEPLRLLAPGDTLTAIPAGSGWFADEEHAAAGRDERERSPAGPPPGGTPPRDEPPPGGPPAGDEPDARASPAPAAECPELRERKRLALSLLERLGPPPSDEPPAAPRGRRRRVRRRRPGASASRAPLAPSPPPPPTEPALGRVSLGVSRGASGGGGRPRLVRSLSPGGAVVEARC